MAETLGSTKLCNTCGKPIPQAALKCTECDTYQNWRRYIAFSNTALALLTALVSVLATSIPIFKAAITPDNSSLSARFGGISGQNVFVLATNSGARPGAVLSGILTYTRDAQPREFPFSTTANADFVEPGGGKRIELRPEKADFIGLAISWFDRNNGRCELGIVVQEFDGTVATKNEEVVCRMVEPIFKAMRPIAVTPYPES